MQLLRIETVDIEGRYATYTTVLASVVTSLRRSAGHGQAYMANEMRIDRSWYGRLERGQGIWNDGYICLAEEALGRSKGEVVILTARVVEKIRPYVPVVTSCELRRLNPERRALTVDNVLRLVDEIRRKTALLKSPAAA